MTSRREFPLWAWIAGFLALLLLAWAIHWSTFRMEVEMRLEDRQVQLTMNGTVLVGELSQPRTGFNAVLYREADTFYPGRLTHLEWRDREGRWTPLVLEPIPPTEPRRIIPRGDWWVDREIRVRDAARTAVSIDAPVILRATLTGRSLHNREIRLESPDPAGNVTFIFRSGLLNNDLLLTEGNRILIGSAQMTAPALDARHFVYTFAAGLAMALLLAGLTGRQFFALPNPTHRGWTIFTVAALAAGAALTFWVGLTVLDGRPHFQDDLGYLVRARWLIQGHLTGAPVQPEAHFQIPYTALVDGRVISQYPIGWPALLAAGEFLGLGAAVAPLCAVLASVAGVFIARQLGGAAVGLATALLLLGSPLHHLLGGSLLAHAAAGMWLTGFVALFLWGWRQPGQPRPWALAAAALALGGLFCTRPLTALAAALPAAIWIVARLIRLRFALSSVLGAAVMLPAGLLASVPALLDNWLVTGHPLVFAYRVTRNSNWTLNAWPEGLFWLERTVAQMPANAFGWAWPVEWGRDWILALPMGFILLRFVLVRASAADWLLLGTCFCLTASYIGYVGGTGLHGFGPRYLAELVPLLAVLAARGFEALADGRSRTLAYAIFAFLVVPAAFYQPKRLADYQGYNDADAQLENALKPLEGKRCLVLLDEPIHTNWIRAARWLPIDPSKPLIVAESKQDNSALLKAYPDREVWRFDLTLKGPEKVPQSP